MGHQRVTQTKTAEANPQKNASIFAKPMLPTCASVHLHPILQLQPTIGNQAVQSLIQAKLKISQPGDQGEQEADRIAAQVMRLPESQTAKESEITESSGWIPKFTPNMQTHVNPIGGGGQPLPEAVRAFFEPRFGHDFSQVRIHTDARAVESAQALNALAYTLGRDIVFGAGQYAPGTTEGRRLLAHELTHVVQQSRALSISSFPKSVHPFYGDLGLEANEFTMGKSSIPISTVTEGMIIQRVAPAVVGVVMWFGKALAATSIDALIDYAIAAITGMPPPGFWSHVGNFFVNLVPGLGEAKKLKNAAKLFKVIDDIIDIVKTFNRLKVPGAGRLLKRMAAEADQFKDAIKAADLSKAKEALGRLLGFLREAQISSKLQEGGAKIVHLGKEIKVGKQVVSEVDIVTEEAGKVVLNQVKAGKRAVLTPGSTDWPKFTNQVEETIKEAKRLKAEQGVETKIRYYVDDISEAARKYLEERRIEIPIEIRMTSEILS